jgi:hypothetical protein
MPKCTLAHSEEETAMVDGGTKVKMPISRRAPSRPPSAPGGCGNLPAPQSMHAAELDAPVAELYVPAVDGASEQSQGGKPEGQARGSVRGRGPVSSMVSGERCAGADHGPPRQ